MPDVDLRIRIAADGSSTLVQTADGLKHVGESANAAQEQLDKFNETLLNGVGLGGGFEVGEKIAEGLMKVGEAFVEAGKEAVEFSHKIELLAEKTGIGTTAWQEFDAAARLSGTTIENVSSVITKMDAAIEKGSAGFEKLGLDIGELKGESPEQAFRDTAEALAGVGNAMERVAIAKQIFGKAGAEALPFIENLAEATRIAHDMGLVLSEEDVKATADLAGAGQELSMIWDGLAKEFVAGAAGGGDFKQIITDLAPAVRVAGEAMRFYGGQIRDAYEYAKLLAELSGAGKFMGGSIGANAGGLGGGVGKSLSKQGPEEGLFVDANSTENQLRYEAEMLKEKEKMAAWSAHIDEQWATQHQRFIEQDGKADEQWVKHHTEQWKKYMEGFGKGPAEMSRDLDQMVTQFEAIGLKQNGAFSYVQMEAFTKKLNEARKAGLDVAEGENVLGLAIDSAGDSALRVAGNAAQMGDAMVAAFRETQREAQATALAIAHVVSTVGSSISEIGNIASSLGAGSLGSALGGVGKVAGDAGSFMGAMATGNVAGMITSGLSGVKDIIGAVKSIFGGKSEGEKIGEDFGGAISAGLAKAIESTETKDHVSRTLAEMLNVDAIFKETGQTNRIFDLMNATKLGAVDAKAGIAELGKAFQDLKTSADGGSVSSEAAMVKMIQRAKELGEHIPAIDAALKGFADDAQKNLADFIGGQGKTISSGQAGADSQIVGDVFALSSSQNGVVAAAEAMQGSIDALVAKLPAGESLTGGAAQAAYYGELAKNKDYAGANKTAVAAARIDKDLVDSGYASQATTDAFGTTAVGSYNQAYAAAGGPGGGDQARIAGEQAILPLLTQLQKDSALGIKISPDAKALLSQANKDGMLPALDVATQSLGYLKDIAANTGGSRGISVGSYSASPGGGSYGSPTGGSNGFISEEAMERIMNDHARQVAQQTVSNMRANGM